MLSKLGIALTFLLFFIPSANMRFPFWLNPKVWDIAIQGVLAQSGQYHDVGLPFNLSMAKLQNHLTEQKNAVYSPSPERTKCYQDVGHLLDAISKKEYWSIKAYDSWGKIGNNIFSGHFFIRGIMSLCLKSHPESNSSFPDYESNFCWFDLTLRRFRGTNRALRMGSCFPKSCDAATLTEMFDSLQALALKIKDFPYVYVSYCSETHIDYFTKNSMVTTSWIIIFTVLGFVFVGTLIDLWLRFRTNNCPSIVKITTFCDGRTYEQISNERNAQIQSIVSAFDEEDEDDVAFDRTQPNNGKDEKKITNQHMVESNSHKEIEREKKDLKNPGYLGKFFLSFSAITNSLSLFQIKKSNDASHLSCLDGIRVLSTGWVVMSHTTSHLYPHSDNPFGTYDMQKYTPISAEVITSGFYAVDSFFVLSGLLVTYLFMRAREKGVKYNWIKWIQFYVDRYIRLSPANFFHLFVLYWGLNLYIPMGPTSVYVQGMDKVCKKTWWYYILYIQNFVKYECFGIDWYLANDMQFFWISPIFLLLFIKIGAWISLIFTGLTIISIGISYKIIVDVDFLHRGYMIQKVRQFPHLAVLASPLYLKFYVRPYCRIGAYLVGMFVGWLLVKVNCRKKLSKIKLLLLWFSGILSIGVSFLLPVLIDMNDFSLNLFTASTHNIWSLGLGILIFLCCTGNAGIINSFLSWPGWQPLSRLSYSVYLMHFLSMKLFYFNTEEIFHITAADNFVHFASLVQYDFLGALFLYMLIESPFINLRKSLFK